MLYIVAAIDVEQANKVVTVKNKKSYVVEIKNFQDFAFKYRNKFKNYNIYYKLNPDGLSKIDNFEVEDLSEFADSVLNFLKLNRNKENMIINEFNLSFSKIRKYMDKLNSVCDYAVENQYNLIGLGD
ncbi:hypothetical protein KQI68_00980 [Peptoniphilus sp. MSJ-1]|uniref:Uncharacterized protein n=1 Tax=Peptoniphilus ovalis TaxID=2841503 RepID=A0ABS6FDZ4_9FIRM|nr:hypothetical protein [Peptoniphilus ovalis]MBU5668406.1 hypothetical protein [Peptoniphilus ovalis]